MTYKTSLDNKGKILTIAITILFAVIIAAQIFFIKEEGRTVSLVTIFSLLAIYFGTFSFRPVGYTLTNEELIIRRPLSNVMIKRSDIKNMEVLDNKQLAWSWRIFGVGGLFGYWGKFSNSRLGSMTWYASRQNTGVLIVTIHEKKIIITPDDPAKFVADFTL